MKIIILLLFITCITVFSVPVNEQRIVGGTEVTIKQYPFTVALLYSSNLAAYYQSCGGSILTTRAILTAAHCVLGDPTEKWRARIGSSWAHSGGTVYMIERITTHTEYNTRSFDNDVAVLRTKTAIEYDSEVRPGSIAGSAYQLEDSQPVWAVGWGTTKTGGPTSEQLRHVQIWTINRDLCRSRYSYLGLHVTDNMVCSGWLNVGGRDQCQGDSGGPLIHNGVIVGICSWGYQCASSLYPGVNTRISRYTSWILDNV